MTDFIMERVMQTSGEHHPTSQDEIDFVPQDFPCPHCKSTDIYYADWSGLIELTGDQGNDEHDLEFHIEDVTVFAHYCGGCGALLDISVTEPEIEKPPVPLEVVQAQAEIATMRAGITSDEGQRNYTEAEMREIEAKAEERTLGAVSRALGGAGYGWDSAHIAKFMRRVKRRMAEEVKHG